MGKVHGSLARAGKVKGQTPKVEKAEKPKKKVGRAKKRIMYNRRIQMEEAAGAGGKVLGPNNQQRQQAEREKAEGKAAA